MNKIFLAITLSFVLGLQTSTLHAGSVAGTGGATEVTALAQLGKQIPINVATAGTAASTAISAAKAIMDPIANALVTVQQLAAAKSMLTLITGGSQGSSLIIGNPQAYIDKQGLAAVKIGLGAIASQQNGPFTNSLLSSITNNFRSPSLTVKLQTINQSRTPSIIQKNACADARLSELAREDVAQGSAVIDETQYQARKQYLYQQLCANNPNTDKATANNLQRLATARPEVGGWDAWLNMTQGDNPYAKAVQANEVIAEAVREREEAAKADLDRGRGTVSQTKCLLRAPTDENGDPYPNPDLAPCLSDVVTNPAGLVGDMLSRAQFAGFDRATNFSGDGFSSLLTDLTTIFSGISDFQSLIAAEENISTYEEISSEVIDDLAGDPEKRESTADPILDTLTLREKAINDLARVDNNINSLLSSYIPQVNATKACYADIGDSSADGEINYRLSQINAMQNDISSDANGIASARTLIASARAEVSTTQSTSRISAVYNNFQRQSRNLPDSNTYAQRESAYGEYKNQVQNDMKSDGQLTALLTRCQQIQAARAQYQGGANTYVNPNYQDPGAGGP